MQNSTLSLERQIKNLESINAKFQQEITSIEAKQAKDQKTVNAVLMVTAFLLFVGSVTCSFLEVPEGTALFFALSVMAALQYDNERF